MNLLNEEKAVSGISFKKLNHRKRMEERRIWVSRSLG
jgi:hypothetical protein